MPRSRFLTALLLSISVMAAAPGCVGPNKLKRGLDTKLNQNYVKRPLLAQLLLPLNIIANHIAVLGDLLIINPTYWWPDVIRGQGTPYIYKNLEIPAEAAVEGEAPGAPGAEGDAPH